MIIYVLVEIGILAAPAAESTPELALIQEEPWAIKVAEVVLAPVPVPVPVQRMPFLDKERTPEALTARTAVSAENENLFYWILYQ